MSRAVRCITVAAILFTAWPALAQRDTLGLGEQLGAKVQRDAGEAFDVELHKSAAKVTAQIGADLSYRKLPRYIQASLGFLVRWGKGQMTVGPRAIAPADTPVQIDARSYVLRDVELLPPVVGLTAVRGPQTGKVVAVDVSTLTVKTKDGTTTGRARLMVTDGADGWWTITEVLVTGGPR